MANQNDNNKDGLDMVMDAIASGDFTDLNASLKTSVFNVMSDVGDSINSAIAQTNHMESNGNVASGVYVERPASATARQSAPQGAGATSRAAEANTQARQQQRAAMTRKPQNRVRFTEVGSVSSVLLKILGWFNVGLFGLCTIGSIGDSPLEVIMFFILTLAFGAMVVAGTRQGKLLKKAKKLKDLASEKYYVTVDDICEATGQKHDAVVRMIKTILDKGFFPEGYLDEAETTFMVSKTVYEQYQASLKSRKAAEAEELAKAAEAYEKGLLTPAQQAAYDKMMKEGREGMASLRKLNDQIPGEVITAKLDRTESVLGEIFTRVQNNPTQVPNCRKLMDYYLPTMLKLLESYAEYDKIQNPGEDMVKAKSEIENTIDIINQSFVELRNKLYQTSAWDAAAEAKVLTSMLRQDGLAADSMSRPKEQIGVDMAQTTAAEDGFMQMNQPIEDGQYIEVTSN